MVEEVGIAELESDIHGGELGGGKETALSALVDVYSALAQTPNEWVLDVSVFRS